MTYEQYIPLYKLIYPLPWKPSSMRMMEPHSSSQAHKYTVTTMQPLDQNYLSPNHRDKLAV